MSLTPSNAKHFRLEVVGWQEIYWKSICLVIFMCFFSFLTAVPIKSLS